MDAMKLRRRTAGAGVLAAVCALAMATAPGAMASHGADDGPGDDNGGGASSSAGGGDDDRAEVTRSGACAGGGRWKLKLKQRDGKLEAEFEIDTNKAGQKWNVTMRKAGAVVFTGQRTTLAPSGSFSVERKVTDLAGADTVTGRAARPGTDQVCSGTATLT